MSVSLYMDVHVPRPITRGLRRRAVEVLTAQEDGASRWPDAELLNRASDLNRVLCSQDDDLLAEAAVRQRGGRHFAGVIYAPQLALTIGQFIDELELIAKAGKPADFADRVTYLPLR